MIDVVIFAVIAAVLVFKLWSKLGKNSDDLDFMGGGGFAHDGKMPGEVKPKVKPKAVSDATFTEIKSDGSLSYAEYGNAAKGLEAIKMVDPYFDPKIFLQGAEAAFEMILGYFAEGNKKGLKSLLGEDIYKSFVAVIDQRKAKGEHLTDTLIGIDKIKIVDAVCAKNTGTITVSIHSQQVHTLRDKDGNIIEGDEQTSQHRIDIWVFERKLKSKDPNWLLMGADSN